MTPSIWSHYQYVVGVDPGYTCTGLVVLAEPGIIIGRHYKGDIGDCLEERTMRLAWDVIAKAYATTQVGRNRVLFAIEDNHITPGGSAQTALQQRELIGAIASGAWHYGFQVIRVAPSSAKLALTGRGNATKEFVREMAAALGGYPAGLPKYADEAVADAVAVAYGGIEKAQKELL